MVKIIKLVLSTVVRHVYVIHIQIHMQINTMKSIAVFKYPMKLAIPVLKFGNLRIIFTFTKM